MKKTNPNDTILILASALLDQGRIFDDKAETTTEIAAKINTGAAHVRRLIQPKIKDGSLEMVWKRIDGKPYPAYRVKRK